jgi:hypothetical protein
MPLVLVLGWALSWSFSYYLRPLMFFDSVSFNTYNKNIIMRTQKLSNHSVKIYDSIEELLIGRFHKYNKCMLVDSGLGSDLQDADGHFVRAIMMIQSGQNELAVKELENLRQGLYLIDQSLSPKHMAYAVLVKEVDGNIRDDISDEGLKETLKMINETPKGVMDWFLESVKKKIEEELTVYFPEQFEDAGVKEYYDILKRRTLYVLEEVQGEDREKEIQGIDNRLLMMNKPKSFSGKGNSEVGFDKNYEEMNIIISQQLSVDPKNMTVVQYYTVLEYLRNKKNPTRRG